MVLETTTDPLKKMRCLLKLGNDITCDLISPAGSIVRNSPAAEYLSDSGLVPRQFHSFGARRGNSEIMARGTFSHTKIKNIMKGVYKNTLHNFLVLISADFLLKNLRKYFRFRNYTAQN